MKVAVLLGNRMNDDGTISAIMEKRLELFLQFNKMVKPDKIIVSGGIANEKANVSEAQKMMEYLIANGIDCEKIIMEDKSLSTKENAFYSALICDELGAKEVYLVTTNEHMGRWFLNPIRLFKKYLSSDKTLFAFSGE